MLYFINKPVFSELRMPEWLVWWSEVTACLGIRNNWIPSSALPGTLSGAFILTFSRGNSSRIDFVLVLVSGIIFNFRRKTFQPFFAGEAGLSVIVASRDSVNMRSHIALRSSRSRRHNLVNNCGTALRYCCRYLDVRHAPGDVGVWCGGAGGLITAAWR